MGSIDWLKLCGFLVVALLITPGCAVVTVDVDVYKGALANHEDVQTEQLVSMAMGAKPLLIQLRDHLEWGEAKANPVYLRGGEALIGRPTAGPEEVLREMRARPWYYAGFIRAKEWKFRNEQAIRVNAILSLYEMRTSSELSAFVEEAKWVLNDYSQAYQTFHPENAEVDEKFWRSLDRAWAAGVETNANVAALEPVLNFL